MVCTHLSVAISCKVKDNHATIHTPGEAVTRRALGGLHGSLWEVKVEQILLLDWGQIGME